MKTIKHILFTLLFIFVFTGVCFHHQAQNTTTTFEFCTPKNNQNKLFVNVFSSPITAFNEETNDQELTSKSNVVSIIDLHLLNDIALVSPQFNFLKKTKNKLFLMCDLPPPFNS